MFNFKEYFKRIISLKKSPHSIALGFAIGTFIAMLPTFGFGPIIALIFLVPLIPNINKISLFGAFFIWNPFVMIPFYYLNYIVGDFVLQSAPPVAIEISFSNMIEMLSLRFLVGNAITSLIMSILGYFIVFAIAWKIKERKKLKEQNLKKRGIRKPYFKDQKKSKPTYKLSKIIK